MSGPPQRGGRDPKLSGGSSGDPLDQPPFAGSLCPACAHHRLVRTPRSVFILCTALPEKYPRQPITTCSAHRPG
jgi:hypothetical protein